MDGYKYFRANHAHGLPSYVLQNLFYDEQKNLKDSLRESHVDDIPRNAISIRSHMIYKLNLIYDVSKMMKSRIAPHFKKYFVDVLKTDSDTCAPTAIRILLSM